MLDIRHEAYVTQRRFRIFKALPKLMGMTREDYLLYEARNQAMVLANSMYYSSITKLPAEPRSLRPNPILPSLDIEAMAKKLVEV